MQMTYKLGSLFDGSGGFPLAGSLCGIEPRWAAEVEPYPIAVTRSRFPNMKHLGDISKINGAEIEPVDIITFGSPCQDLSIAGKRAGLKHESNGDEETTRSGLFMEAVRIIKEMREATNGEYPTFALWENVPGAFSSNKGEDFRIVCEELIKIVEPTAVMPAVPKAGWSYSDSYCGDGWSLAYRVFDAQYWGVPQRRRRIHLILDLRGERAREVLFEREGVRGYFAQGRTPWQGITADAQDGIGADDRAGEICDVTPINMMIATRHKQLGRGTGFGVAEIGDPQFTISAGHEHAVAYTLKIRSGCEGGGKGALIQTDKSATLSTLNDQYLFQPIGINGEVAGTLDASYFKGCGMRQGVEREVVAIPIHDQATRFSGKRGDKSDGKGNGLGVGETGDPMNTLTSGDRHAVAYTMQAFGEYKDCGVASGLKARDYKDATDLVAEVCGTFQNTGIGWWNETPIGATVRTPCGGDSTLANVCVEKHNIRYIVRRLTPTECARLQGFADRWGDIDVKDDFTEEEYRFWLEVRNTHAAINGKKVQDYTKAQMVTWYNRLHTDSSEYKMWGNGIALPPALYCMQGMMDAFCGMRKENPEMTEVTKVEIDTSEELIKVKQLPIIEERLRAAKDYVDATVESAMSLVCTEETVQSVKATRADLNKQFADLEEKRKAVKSSVLAPYQQFEAVYKECVSDAFKKADADLKKKINDVEGEMKRRCEDALRDYFAELCAVNHIDFVPYERAGITVSMADAKAKTQPPKKLKEQLSEFVSGIVQGMELIASMDCVEEIMVEFRQSLDAARSISIVQARHKRIEEEKAARAAREEAKARETEVVKKVESFAPPVAAPVAPKVGRVTFTVTDTIDRLKILKKFLVDNGYKYE